MSWACAGRGAKANAAMAAAVAAESMIFLRIVTFLHLLTTDPASQRDSTQAYSNRCSFFLSNETAIGLSVHRLGNKPGPAVVTAEQNEIANRGLKTRLPCLQTPPRRWQLERHEQMND